MSLRSSGLSNLTLQQQYHDEAYRLLLKGVELEESGSNQQLAAENYTSGIQMLQRGLDLKFLPSER